MSIRHFSTAIQKRSDPDVCARCASLGPTCCQLVPGQEEACFPVSTLERNRIVDVVSQRGGFTRERNSAAFVNNMARLFPGERKVIMALFPADQFHFRLSTHADGKCTFLESAGCMLPTEVRPYYCRIFPLWVVRDMLTVFTASQCLAQKEGRTVPGVVQAIGTTEQTVRKLHGKLRLAWGLPPREGMAFVSSVKA
ncbi:YkgJ family cysteine cluster protein [Desulfovibrio inopinatus]|uniref:YkgJ family cysteine cluster protein n=1 Tax=Desulfovibrio inopinatus TaxID=102109 RepID=UPI001FE15F2C|nr:zinc/iron-chelating domain-containing protein [Desulfovibrio inopinatus]